MISSNLRRKWKSVKTGRWKRFYKSFHHIDRWTRNDNVRKILLTTAGRIIGYGRRRLGEGVLLVAVNWWQIHSHPINTDTPELPTHVRAQALYIAWINQCLLGSPRPNFPPHSIFVSPVCLPVLLPTLMVGPSVWAFQRGSCYELKLSVP